MRARRPRAEAAPRTERSDAEEEAVLRTYPCPIRGCSYVFRGSRAGWDSHVASLRIHPDWHADVVDPAARTALFREEFPEFFASGTAAAVAVEPPTAVYPVSRGRCDTCGEPLEPFAAINVTGKGEYCFRCYNDALAGEHDIDFDNAELQPVTLRDAGGRPHTFRIHSLLVGTGHRMEAVEVREDGADGYRFCVLGDVEHDALALFRALYERMRVGLAARHIEFGSHGWQITDADRVVGRIESDRELGPDVPRIVVDGHELSWDEFGRMLMTFEGFELDLRIRDYIEEVPPPETGGRGGPGEGEGEVS